METTILQNDIDYVNKRIAVIDFTRKILIVFQYTLGYLTG